MARHIRSTIHNSRPLAMTIEKEDNFSIVEFVNLAISAAWSRSYGEKAISIGFQPRDHVVEQFAMSPLLFPALSRTGTSRSFAKAMLVPGARLLRSEWKKESVAIEVSFPGTPDDWRKH